MDEQSRAAFIIAQAAMLNARIAEMQAANQYRTNCGHQIAYGDDAFAEVIEEYKSLEYNAALGFLRGL